MKSNKKVLNVVSGCLVVSGQEIKQLDQRRKQISGTWNGDNELMQHGCQLLSGGDSETHARIAQRRP